MPSLSTARTSNAAWSPSYTPVGIFVGGTSGIGEAMATAFAQHTNGNAHVVLVGRNGAAARKIMTKLPQLKITGDTDQKIEHEFCACDLSSLRDVKRVVGELLLRFPKVNLLVLTAGTAFTTVKETSEGILDVLGAIYYGRWAFIDGLLPALRSAKGAGEDARVMSVYNAGMGIPLDLDDLGLQKGLVGTSNIMKNRGQLSTYHDLMVETFAAHDPAITFIHAHPGGVLTPLLKNSPSATLRLARFVLVPIIFITAYSEVKNMKACGEHQLYALLTAPAGASRTGLNGDSIGRDGYAGTEEMAVRLWEHTKGRVHAA